jgi:hypothetical protein
MLLVPAFTAIQRRAHTLINCKQETHIYCTGNMESKKAYLMANIPEDLICRGIKDMMKSHSQLHHPQARP